MARGKAINKGGRPAGSSSLGIPMKGLPESITMVKTIYDTHGKSLMSFQDFIKCLGLQKANGTTTAGALNEYGLIEKVGDNWKVSDLGEMAVKGNPQAIKECLEKNLIFKDLSNNYWDKEITSGVIVAYIKKRYKKGPNVHTITERFLEARSFIRSFGEPSEAFSLKKDVYMNSDVIGGSIPLIKLYFCLNPLQEKEMASLALDVANKLADEDIAISTIAKSISANAGNPDVVKVLVGNLLDIARGKYPFLDQLGSKAKKKAKEEAND